MVFDSAAALTASEPEALDAALARFGLTAFRPGQREVIESVLSGAHTLAVMPTGAGKSLCYQLPAVLFDGVTLVVSPLISLMKDQVDALRARGIAAVDITSAIDEAERNRRMQQVAAGEAKLVYVAPERFRSARFVEALSKVSLALVAVDEAHCVSQWGHDFRPDYLRLGEAFAKLKPARIMALTATATPEVRGDIERLLAMDDARVFVRGFDRPNLIFAVEPVRVAQKVERISELVATAGAGGASIVYVGTRKNAEAIAAELTGRGIRAGVYHGGLRDEDRAQVQNRFMAGDFDVLVATNAFGMGVDKPNVRLVVHADVPRSLEAYYQEAGRAGRDGARSECVLLFNGGDVKLQEYFIDGSYPPADLLRAVWRAIKDDPAVAVDENRLAAAVGHKNGKQVQAAVRTLLAAGLLGEGPSGEIEAVRPSADAPPFDPELPARRAAVERQKLQQMTAYAYNRQCRRRAILDYFGDEAAPAMARGCGACDNCLGRKARALSDDERAQASSVLAAVRETGGRFGRQKLCQILLGEASDELRARDLHRLGSFGALRGRHKNEVFDWFEALIGDGFLQVASGEYPTLELTLKGEDALRSPDLLASVAVLAARRAPPAKPKKLGAKAPAITDAAAEAPPVNAPLFEALREMRGALAREAGLPAYCIFSNKTLEALARHAPITKDALATISGIGPARSERFGDQILALTREHG